MLKSIFGVKTPLLRAEVKKSIIFSCLSSQEIKDLKAPHCQRLVDPLHVQSIYNFQKSHHQKYGEFFFILPVVIAQFESVRYVIDGQQRLTTIQILLAALRDICSSEEDLDKLSKASELLIFNDGLNKVGGRTKPSSWNANIKNLKRA